MMTADAANAPPCECGCGATLEASEYGPVCACGCEDEKKAHTVAQEIHDLQIHQAEIDRRLHELIEAGLRQPAA